LQGLISDVEHLAVLFYTDDCDECDDILEELETIDDDTDKHGIQFVKSKDAKLASEIGIFSFPALVYYETGVPIMYDGNLNNEDRVLEWLVEQKRDGCFYIGMGGKGQLPNPSYEPYQCCPSSKPTQGSKLAKLAAKGTAKQVAKSARPLPKETKKPERLAPARPVSKANHPTKVNKETGKEKNLPVKPEKGKGKKGFFGTGKYIWWW
jgi:hypothetical protein